MNTTLDRTRDGYPVPAHFPVAARHVLGLAPRDCRWPLGDPASDAFAFCDRPAAGRGSYCAPHRRMACETPRPAREPSRLADEAAR